MYFYVQYMRRTKQEFGQWEILFAEQIKPASAAEVLSFGSVIGAERFI